MFTQPASTLQGSVHHVEGAMNVPQPIRRGGPPILVGGGGERKTLRLTATYADMWNGFGEVAMIRHKLDVLEEHCEAVGRDRSEIAATRLGTLIVGETAEDADRRRRAWQEARGVDDAGLAMRLIWGDRAAVAEQARGFLDAGRQGLIFNMPAGSKAEENPWEIGTLEWTLPSSRTTLNVRALARLAAGHDVQEPFRVPTWAPAGCRSTAAPWIVLVTYSLPSGPRARCCGA
jgi:hypothetical protein